MIKRRYGYTRSLCLGKAQNKVSKIAEFLSGMSISQPFEASHFLVKNLRIFANYSKNIHRQMQPINLNEKLAVFSKQWHPHQIAVVDDMQVILAKIQGEFVWHTHENEDELFQVLKGTLYMQFRDRTEMVHEGEIIVVPKGVEHCPSTQNGEEVQLLLFEKLNTAHTGDVVHEMTQSHYPKI